MQHGYGDQQEHHGCWEMRKNSWNSVYTPVIRTYWVGRLSLCVRELASLTLSDMVSMLAVTLRGNCRNTDPVTSAQPISSYLQTQVRGTAAFTRLFSEGSMRSVIGTKRKKLLLCKQMVQSSITVLLQNKANDSFILIRRLLPTTI